MKKLTLRKRVLQLAACAWAGLAMGRFCLGQTPSAPPSHPNVVFVIADQWREQAFGFAGDPNVKTPNFDAFSRVSIRMVNAVSNLPVCSPARATILTGQLPLTHGVFMNDVALDPHAESLAKVLRSAGYDTGLIGKWHVNGGGRSAYIPPERRQGFDYWKALECTHEYLKSFYYAGENQEKQVWPGYDAIAQTQDAMQYIRDHAHGDHPFFLFLSWGPPHNPYGLAPEKYKKMYSPEKMQLEPNVPDVDRFRRDLASYYSNCTALDDCFGQLRSCIHDAGIEQNTLVIFTSDHGNLLGSHRQIDKQQPYEESVRVPMLFSEPKLLGDQGRELEGCFNMQDIMPTVLGLCGLKSPPSVQGKDLSAYLAGGKDSTDSASLISCVIPFGVWNRLVGGKEYRGVRTHRYTYVRDLHGPWLLFDNQTDPFQLNNLVGQPGSEKVEADLQATLERMLKESGDDFRPGPFYVQKWGYKLDKTGTVHYTN